MSAAPWEIPRWLLILSQAMKRQLRLRRPAQFQRVRREGHQFSIAELSLQIARGRASQTRCGFVVSKRIGNAVVRNRLRRRLREIIRLLYPDLQPQCDLVFIVRSPALTALSHHELQRRVVGLLQRAHALRLSPPPTEA